MNNDNNKNNLETLLKQETILVNVLDRIRKDIEEHRKAINKNGEKDGKIK